MNGPMEDRAAVPAEPVPVAGTDAVPQSGGKVAQVTLPPVMTSRYATELLGDLQAMRGQPISLDASSVQKIGALCLQVLLSAHRTWTADGLPFCMTGTSEALASRCKLFGLPLGESVECGA